MVQIMILKGSTAAHPRNKLTPGGIAKRSKYALSQDATLVANTWLRLDIDLKCCQVTPPEPCRRMAMHATFCDNPIAAESAQGKRSPLAQCDAPINSPSGAAAPLLSSSRPRC